MDRINGARTTQRRDCRRGRALCERSQQDKHGLTGVRRARPCAGSMSSRCSRRLERIRRPPVDRGSRKRTQSQKRDASPVRDQVPPPVPIATAGPRRRQTRPVSPPIRRSGSLHGHRARSAAGHRRQAGADVDDCACTHDANGRPDLSQRPRSTSRMERSHADRRIPGARSSHRARPDTSA
jgi:hypothetical protein